MDVKVAILNFVKTYRAYTKELSDLSKTSYYKNWSNNAR